ncbi:hypothetical protein NDU88_007519 [Pleurodeles waltl]|uniref:Uncharacterized protein n=1 Tax=Pleurodeles waltl TaxID=8319 RepID=A0AAV7N646_PLEWA|nr:hypothetical protein NDU88_007519 [Pleurodeles waltl]
MPYIPLQTVTPISCSCPLLPRSANEEDVQASKLMALPSSRAELLIGSQLPPLTVHGLVRCFPVLTEQARRLVHAQTPLIYGLPRTFALPNQKQQEATCSLWFFRPCYSHSNNRLPQTEARLTLRKSQLHPALHSSEL